MPVAQKLEATDWSTSTHLQMVSWPSFGLSGTITITPLIKPFSILRFRVIPSHPNQSHAQQEL